PVHVDRPRAIRAGIGEGAEVEAVRAALAGALVGGGAHARRHVVDGHRGRVLGEAAVLVADLALDRPAAVIRGRAARAPRAAEGAVAGAGAAVERVREAGRGVGA